MLNLRCASCRLIWQEDRREGDSPIGPHVFLCPRCGELGERTLGLDDLTPERLAGDT